MSALPIPPFRFEPTHFNSNIQAGDCFLIRDADGQITGVAFDERNAAFIVETLNLALVSAHLVQVQADGVSVSIDIPVQIVSQKSGE